MPTTLTYTAVGGEVSVTVRNVGSGAISFTFSCEAPADPVAGTPAPAPPIPAWVQAYGRASKDATCINGWSPSWQKWAEPVTGGWVCTRNVPSYG